MQHRSKHRQKDRNRWLVELQGRTFSLLTPQFQDNAATMHVTEDDEINHEHARKVSSRALFSRQKLVFDMSTPPCGSLSYPCSLSKLALLSGSSSDDDSEQSTGKLHERNCLNMWKNFGSWHPQGSAKSPLDALPSVLGLRSSKGVPVLQGNSRIMPEREEAPSLPIWRCFTIEEITLATNSFHPDNIVGKGGYAKVYKGTLADGQVIAIKKLCQSDAKEQNEKDFLVEIGVMAHVSHPNTTLLIGFCLEGGLYLIYDFYPNGSVANLLYGTKLKSFGWPLRYKVAVGTARGLQYLHKHCRRRIIHRDIKASNILLDSEFEPQIADFGLAKWLPTEWTHHSVSPVEGTYGYLAPEYYMHGIVDEKTDVYSFGVLLLEILSGRQPTDDTQQSLVIWAKPLLESQNLRDLADPELHGSYDYHQMRCMMITAEMCVRQTSVSRPSMAQVLELLCKYS